MKVPLFDSFFESALVHGPPGRLGRECLEVHEVFTRGDADTPVWLATCFHTAAIFEDRAFAAGICDVMSLAAELRLGDLSGRVLLRLRIG